MVVGEIGRERIEFLYEMSYCDIALVIRGYRRRNILTYQLLRTIGYGTFHAMSGDKQQKGPDGWMPLYFDKYKENNQPPITKEEEQDMLALLNDLNSQ